MAISRAPEAKTLMTTPKRTNGEATRNKAKPL
jgi:hypothetical protein